MMSLKSLFKLFDDDGFARAVGEGPEGCFFFAFSSSIKARGAET
jgi:hypothetical protein